LILRPIFLFHLLVVQSTRSPPPHQSTVLPEREIGITMSTAKRRLQAISKQVVDGIPDEGTFENVPRIRHVAGSSTGPYVECIFFTF